MKFKNQLANLNDKSFIRLLIILFLGLLPFRSLGITYQPQKNLSQLKDSVLAIFEQKIADAADDSIKKIDAYYDFGQYLDVNGEKDASIKNLKIAFRIAQNIGSDKDIAAIGNFLASTYWEIGIYQPSIDIYILAYESAVRTRDVRIKIDLPVTENESK